MAAPRQPEAEVQEGNSARRGLHPGLLLVLVAVFSRAIRTARGELVSFAPEGPWDLRPSKMFAAVPVLLALVYLLGHPRRKAIRIDIPLKILLVLMGYGAISALWAPMPDEIPVWLVKTTTKVLFYILVITFTVRWHDIHHWGHMFIYMSLILPVMVALEWSVFREVALSEGTHSYFAIYGQWSTLALPFTLHYVLFPRNAIERVLGASGLIAGNLAIALSARRAPLIAIPLMLLVYFLLAARRRRDLLRIVALLAAGLAIAVALNPLHVQRLESMLQLGGTGLLREEHLSGRFIRFFGALEVTRTHWLLGLGAGNFRAWAKDALPFGVPTNPHNLTLYLTSNLGIVGLAIFGVFVLCAYGRMRRALRICLTNGDLTMASFVAATVASFVGMLFYAQFEPFFHSTQIYVVAALGSVTLAIVRERYGEANGSAASSRPATSA
ncbi:MAG: O-antigen ligase family protein [Armatimonadota bacterium]